MAEVEYAIKARLEAVSGVTDLVAARIYPAVLPQNPTLPAITFQRIDGPRLSAMTNDVWAEPRIQINSYAAKYTGAKALAQQVRIALQRWSGTSAGVVIHDIFIENDRDNYDDEVEAWRVIADYLVQHDE